MHKLLGAAGVALMLQLAPAGSQAPQPPPAQIEQPPRAGAAIFTSDGQHLGQVVETLVLDGKVRALRVEIGGFLGIGSTTAFIPAKAYRQAGDRVELLMTADEVRDSVSKQGGPGKQ